MSITELKRALAQDSNKTLRFTLPNGNAVPAHAHVTEVARIDKHFVDCGGTVRQDSTCRLQAWVAGDEEHRLTAGKLARILEKAKSLLRSDDLDVDVEYELGNISQFPVESIQAQGAEMFLKLGERHTSCLAQDQCRLPTELGEECCRPAAEISEFKPLTPLRGILKK